MGTALFFLLLVWVIQAIYRKRGGPSAQRVLDREFARQFANFRATWPILVIILGVNLLSFVTMFYLSTPEYIQTLAVLGFFGSGMALILYISFVSLNGLFGRR